jgi:hypothetical protein
MLSNQELPYVGRFACDWLRLATTDPGATHASMLRPLPSICPSSTELPVGRGQSCSSLSDYVSRGQRLQPSAADQGRCDQACLTGLTATGSLGAHRRRAGTGSKPPDETAPWRRYLLAPVSSGTLGSAVVRCGSVRCGVSALRGQCAAGQYSKPRISSDTPRACTDPPPLYRDNATVPR